VNSVVKKFDMQHILAIDYGTQSVRAFLFDLKGEPVARAKLTVEPYYSTQPGWAEQQPDYFWDRLCEVCQRLWETTDVAKDSIVGVAVTTQRATVLNLDKNGHPLRPAMIWLDRRRAENLLPVGGVWGAAFKALRLEKDIARAQAECEANWLKQNQPEIWENTHKFLFLSGYFNYRLTGQFADSVGSQVGYLPFDSKRHKWANRLDWKWQAMAYKPEQLPDLVAPGEVLGRITARASEQTGIPAGLPVLAAAADKACEVLGAGCLEPYQGCLSYGTHATINVMYKKYLEVLPPLPPYPAAVPGAYNLELGIYRGYWMVSWFKNEFAHYEQQIAGERGIEPEELFDELVNRVPPGSLGLIVQPYWMPSFKDQSPEAKGGIIGFGDVHTRAHVYRAILEGIAYALRAAKEKIEKRTGQPLTELRVSGGGARSDAAMQLTADVFNLPVARLHTSEVSSLGAAIDAAVGLKLYPDFRAATGEMSRVAQTFEPSRAASETYEQLFRRVYLKMYERLHPLYAEIQQITGYPQL
jgi:sugar (pentulose or hexulose) kinase